MEIFAPYLGSLLDYATYQNLRSETLRKDLINPDLDIANPNEMVDANEYLAVFNHVIEATDSEYCGLNFGCYLNLGALGLVLEISLNTSSIEQGVHILQNFLDTKFPLVSAKIIEDSQQYILELDSPIEDVKVKKHLLDMILSIIYRELKLMLNKPFEPKIRLPFTDNEPYNDALNVEVTYHSSYQLLLPLEILNTEINKNRVKEIELLLPKFIAMLNKKEEDGKFFSHQVRNMILNMCSPEIPFFEQIQKQFPYSNRTMQRKLTNEGMSFRGIVNTIKEELSNYLINEKHFKTKDVAFILGYSESSAYLHAVNSWKKKKRT
ncbi:AraC family transcriptional regulator ligand-binding domain-containing protein [Cyclobacterium sp.]|uniref:AraC family transcriptional regulator ligand-binding domain-containing protein n=1 Tax=Cyclobacterium sp. TaxID=1966343 RepID=UPI0019A7FEC1|nr:AraC family transcriptional regulator ligand-binding domain-containing protein [Cyclobacterium sp.]MBD3630037.1 AraC family transcriptional regulator ligand-binding domain-containing protein [Cyclobacterium sp.]